LNVVNRKDAEAQRRRKGNTKEMQREMRVCVNTHTVHAAVAQREGYINN
jgi:hypothetical protein